MTPVSLIVASKKLDERKSALFAGEAAAMHVDQMPLYASGFDLDPDEMRQLADAVALAMLNPANLRAMGRPTLDMLARGAFVEGLMTGLMLAKLRAEEVTS